VGLESYCCFFIGPAIARVFAHLMSECRAPDQRCSRLRQRAARRAAFEVVFDSLSGRAQTLK